MKRLCLSYRSVNFLLVGTVLSWNLNAQQKNVSKAEIIFSNRDFNGVQAAAKANHKKIFVDAYATWCAPCKELQKSTFKDAKAAAYFNKNFINFRVNVEKGEGIELAKKWRVEGLPTLLILDENGKKIAGHIGFVNGEGLMEFVKEASGK